MSVYQYVCTCGARWRHLNRSYNAQAQLQQHERHLLCFPIFHHLRLWLSTGEPALMDYICPSISPVVDIYLNNSVNRTNVYFCLILLFNWSVKFYRHRQTRMLVLTLGVIQWLNKEMETTKSHQAACESHFCARPCFLLSRMLLHETPYSGIIVEGYALSILCLCANMWRDVTWITVIMHRLSCSSIFSVLLLGRVVNGCRFYYYYYYKCTDYSDASQSCRGTLHIRFKTMAAERIQTMCEKLRNFTKHEQYYANK